MQSDDELKQMRSDYLRDCKPKEFRRLRQAGDLEQHLQDRADRCRRRAAQLVDNGTTFKQQAEQWAIREVLLDSPWD